MDTRRLLVPTFTITILLTASLSDPGAFGQGGGHIEVFVTGAMSGRAFSAPFGRKSIMENDKLDVARNIQPGAEIVFKPQSRVSFGASFSQEKFATKLKDHYVIFGDHFTYLADGKPTVYQGAPGTTLAYVDSTESAKSNIILGNVYFNIPTEAMVKPFFGGGAGVMLTRIEWKNNQHFDPIVTKLIPLMTPDTNIFHSTEQVPIFRFLAGVKIRPARHLVIRGAAGYLNGSYGTVGIGFGF